MNDTSLEIHWFIKRSDSGSFSRESIDEWDEEEVNEDETIEDYILDYLKRKKPDVGERLTFHAKCYEGWGGETKHLSVDTRIGDVPVTMVRREGQDIKLRWITIDIKSTDLVDSNGIALELKRDSWEWLFKVLYGQKKGLVAPIGEHGLGNFWAIVQHLEDQYHRT